MNAVILGSADCLYDDMVRLLELGPWRGLVIVVNETGVFYTGPIDHWVTMHGEKLDWWRSKRQGNTNYKIWDTPDCKGSSGGAAVLVALDELECPRVVLCGVPMDTRAHLRRGGNWTPAEQHRPWWEQLKPVFGDRVRSMSGWTKELLGEPTKEWLNGNG